MKKAVTSSSHISRRIYWDRNVSYVGVRGSLNLFVNICTD